MSKINKDGVTEERVEKQADENLDEIAHNRATKLGEEESGSLEENKKEDIEVPNEDDTIDGIVEDQEETDTIENVDVDDSKTEECVISEFDRVKEQLASIEKENAENKNKVMMAYAELENFKKRNQQEVAQYKKFALEKFVLELLPIKDGFERADGLKEKEDSKLQEIVDGYSMIQKQLDGILDKFQVKRIDAKNAKFDPNFHQSISQIESADVETDTVVEEAQAGYLLNERVIRPSLVIVSK
ncbi:nucleotide exchange factor GrpE [bacterium]|jgi:molecular chaperone GrpE|nr:nucleotide exchange factor GrpE [bacterium]